MLDLSEVKFCYSHASTHSIKYELFKADEATASGYQQAKEQDLIKKKSGACFASLLTEYVSTYDKVCYKVEPDPASEDRPKSHPPLTSEEMVKWVGILKRWKMLPKSSYSDFIIVDLAKYPINMVYFYLTAFRYMREDTGTVKAFLSLADKQGVNPYIALVVANSYCNDYVGHSLLSKVSSSYLEKNKHPEESRIINLDMARRVRLFVSDPWKYDTRHANKVHMGNMFSLHMAIDTKVKTPATSGTLKTRLKHIRDEDVVKYVMTDSDKETEELYLSIGEKCKQST